MKAKKPCVYHYTKRFDWLCSILETGFWPQYSLEDFSWVRGGGLLYLAFPCVCFTELPLDKSQMHRGDYGNYVIGFGRDWAGVERLRPMQYIGAKEKAIPILKPHHCRALTKCGSLDVSGGLMHFPPTKLKPEDFDGVWDILPYLKENLGFTLQRLPKPRGDKSHIFHVKELKDEHEWRYIPENHGQNLFSVDDYDTKTMGELNKLSETTHDSHLIFDHSEVATVIVTTDAERQQLAARHPKLKGKIRIWCDFSKANEGEPGEADFVRAGRHERGAGVKKDFYLALKHYRAAAKAGHLGAQLRLGHVYLQGEHLKKPRYQNARDYFYLAAKQGNAEAQREIGWLYYKGLGVEEDPGQAIKYLHQAADQGDVEAVGWLGWIYFHGRNAFKWRVVRGRMQEIKDPVKNYRKAVHWSGRAAEAGLAYSMQVLGVCLLEGKGVKAHPAKGMRWLREAASRGLHSAQAHLGALLAAGRPWLKRDANEALKWLKRAAKSNDMYTAVNATNQVWETYFHGKGVSRDYRMARVWAKKALDLAQDGGALSAMVEIYRKGLGVKADEKQAVVWEKRLRAF